MALNTQSGPQQVRQMLNKVPEVTVYFWIIKVLSTTVGETAADFLNVNLHLGLGGTTLIMAVALAAVLGWQFRTGRYVAGIYWLAVVLISIVGTLITDNLTDSLGVPLTVSTAVFGVMLGAIFVVWYRSEGTLSIHSIVTPRREAFYWAAILFTFALGTAAGDLLAEGLDLGYWRSGMIFAALIAVVASVYARSWMNPILAFWIAYILTRPLGASLGDYLSQARDDGGLGFGTVITSGAFLATIVVLALYLGVTKRDAQMPVATPGRKAAAPQR